MTETLRNQIARALEEKKKQLASLESDVQNLGNAYKRAERYDIYWSEKVTAKNLAKSEAFARIIDCIDKSNQRSKRRKALKITDFGITTKSLWQYTSDLTAPRNVSASPLFRRYLNEMQKNELLEYNADKQKWKITEKGEKLIIKKPRHGNDEA